MMNEQCWILLGFRIWKFWLGILKPMTMNETPVRVDFDAAWVMDRDEKKGDLLGFLHTHPSFPANPSGVDYRTMRAWRMVCGKPLICAIRGTNGLHLYEFFDDDSEPYVLRGWQCGSFMFGFSKMDEYLTAKWNHVVLDEDI